MLKFYRRKLNVYMSHYRNQVFKMRVTESKKRVVLSHWVVKDLRLAFNKWKHQAMQAKAVEEVNEEGPVVEEVLDAQMNVYNLRKFMEDEGFTPRQVDEVANHGQRKGDTILRKAVCRWRNHANGGHNYLRARMWDRWRKFVHMRKIVRHWLGFIENRQQHIKADLYQAFNKWRYSFADKQNALQKMPYKALKRRAAMACKTQEDLAEQTMLEDDTHLHLSDQNDELFKCYKKGMKLACALRRDNMHMSKVKAFGKYRDGVKAI